MKLDGLNIGDELAVHPDYRRPREQEKLRLPVVRKTAKRLFASDGMTEVEVRHDGHVIGRPNWTAEPWAAYAERAARGKALERYRTLTRDLAWLDRADSATLGRICDLIESAGPSEARPCG